MKKHSEKAFIKWVKAHGMGLDDSYPGSAVLTFQSGLDLALQGGKLPGQLARVAEHLPHANERTHNENAHLNGSWAPQDGGGHDCPVFREDTRKRPAAAMARTGHRL